MYYSFSTFPVFLTCMSQLENSTNIGLYQLTNCINESAELQIRWMRDYRLED